MSARDWRDDYLDWWQAWAGFVGDRWFAQTLLAFPMGICMGAGCATVLLSPPLSARGFVGVLLGLSAVAMLGASRVVDRRIRRRYAPRIDKRL